MSFFRSSGNSQEFQTEIDCCRAEIKAMEKVQEEYYQDMVISHQIEVKRKFMETPIGKIFKWIGKIVAFFCIFKVLTTIRAVFFLDDATRNNALSTKIKNLLIVLHVSFSQDVYNELIIQFCLFGFVGIIIYINVNSLFSNLLISLKNVLMRELKVKFSSNTTVLIFGFFMSIYFISNVFLMRMGLHDGNREADYINIKLIFDYVFLISTLGSICILSFNRYVKS